MGRLVGVFVLLLLVCAPRVAVAAPAGAMPTVKEVALAFGQAIEQNNGAAALKLLAPDLRARLKPDQLPGLLNVQSPPLGARVVRWAYDNGRGDVTLVLRYADHVVAEHLFFRLFGEGWRITAIVPQDPLALRRGAEEAVTAFCDAAIRGDPATMRAQLTAAFAARAHTASAAFGLLGIHSSLLSYQITSFFGTPAGADIMVRLTTEAGATRDRFAVINDRDGWRIAAIEPAPTQ